MDRVITDSERRARLALRHRLHPATRVDDDVPGIADAVIALHSSDPATVYLSAMARMANPARDAVERALYDDRSLIRHLAMRRTLWVGTPERMRQAHVSASRRVAAAEHRKTVGFLEANDISDGEAWLTAAKTETLAALHKHGPMTTRELGKLVPRLTHKLRLAPGKPYSVLQGAHTRVLALLAMDGALVRTRARSWTSGEYTWAVMDDWLPGGIDGLELRDAARELAAAWLTAFGPASEADLAWWAGWTKTMTRTALEDCGAEPVRLEDGSPAWVAAGDTGAVSDPGPWVALLPSLDVTTMGWKARDWYLPAAARDAFDNYGNGGPTIWVDGVIVGAWAQHPQSGELRQHYFVPVPKARRAEIDARGEELLDWVDGTIVKARFPGNVQKALLSD